LEDCHQRLKEHGVALCRDYEKCSVLRPVQLYGELIPLVESARYLGVTLDTRLTWSAHVNQVERKMDQRLGVLDPLLNRRSGLYIRNVCCFISSSSAL
jgi:hypothetical protein